MRFSPHAGCSQLAARRSSALVGYLLARVSPLVFAAIDTFAESASGAAFAVRGIRSRCGRKWQQGCAGGQGRQDRSRYHVDIGLPDFDGREAVRILRKHGFKAPIIMLTGHDTDSDNILGFESGANDYVAKPFRFAVLLARIRAQLRQHEASEDAVFTIGPHTFRPSSKILLNPNGNKVRLTEKETSILRYLFRAGQKPVSRETMLQEVWGYNSGVTTHTLETHIYRLRQKIEKDAAAPAILVTEAGGYKLVP
jgi:DNA-binding response OmpR family regulator